MLYDVVTSCFLPTDCSCVYTLEIERDKEIKTETKRERDRERDREGERERERAAGVRRECVINFQILGRKMPQLIFLSLLIPGKLFCY